jgi:hypothetical protein
MLNSSLLLFFSNTLMPSNIGRHVLTKRLANIPTPKTSLLTRLVCLSPNSLKITVTEVSMTGTTKLRAWCEKLAIGDHSIVVPLSS